MKTLLLLFFAFITTFGCYAQQTSSASVHTLLNQRNQDFIREIYGNEYVTTETGIYEGLIQLLNERVSLFEEAPAEGEKYILLSTLPLMNSINPAIAPFSAADFDVNTFNPLRYGWNFFDSKPQIFRIDGTNYLLVVEPQTVKYE